MRYLIYILISIIAILIFSSFDSPIITLPTIESTSNQYSVTTQKNQEIFAFDSINQYVTYTLPETLVDGNYTRELGYLGGSLFCLKETGSYIAKQASDGTPPGWNSFGGIEMYYQLNCEFYNDQLTDVSLPWNHAVFITEIEPIADCAEPAVVVQVCFDLYTAPEINANNIPKSNQTSTMWYVFFANDSSKISYAIFLDAERFSKETTISLARSVKFSPNAFDLIVK